MCLDCQTENLSICTVEVSVKSQQIMDLTTFRTTFCALIPVWSFLYLFQCLFLELCCYWKKTKISCVFRFIWRTQSVVFLFVDTFSELKGCVKCTRHPDILYATQNVLLQACTVAPVSPTPPLLDLPNSVILEKSKNALQDFWRVLF